MNILVTGGTGVIGEGVVPELVRRGHHVRLLSRHANEDAQQWPGVEPFVGDVAEATSIASAAAGCDAVVHIAGIAEEERPERTFARVNVGGTRNLIEEARRSNVKRFVFVSSLGVEHGTSDYQQSKREAEELVRGSLLSWTIVRAGSVYGPGDEVISRILKMVRTLPVVPVVDDGEQQFQPIWHEDLAKVLALCVERDDLAEQILEAAGPDITSMNDLVRRFAEITGRSPMRVPVPAPLAQLAIDHNKLMMLEEENVLRGTNAMDTLSVEPTPLDRGLRLLADALQETLPEEGFGALEHKRFHAEMRGSRFNAVALMTLFRERVNDFMPIEFVAEPGAPNRIEKGATLTGALPLRGNFQVRVEVAEPTHVVFATIEGHPLAGIVEFTTADTTSGVSFSVDVFTRASNVVDWIAARTIGAAAQNSNWRNLVQRIIEASGGTSDGVHEEKEKLDETAATAVEKRIRTIVHERKKDEVLSRQ
jgi:NADH dehydrogenase